MKILFVVPYVPDLIRVRPYNFILSLAEQGHEITLATVWTDDREREALAYLETVCARIIAVRQPRWRSLANSLWALPSGKPLQAVYSWNPELARALDTLFASEAAPFDAIHVEHLRGVAYALHLQELLRRRAGVQPLLVWDSVDSISLLFRQAAAHNPGFLSRLINQLELPRTEKYEGWLVSQFAHILITSAKDKAALLALLPEQERARLAERITVLPNGVDLNLFCLDPAVARHTDTLVVTGKMSYHANVAMVLNLAREIMPHVWRHFPQTKLQIVGKDPVSAIARLAEHPQVTVTGTVPEIRSYLQQATIAVATIQYGVGIQNKILEAMACGTPVVTTPPAIDALDVEPGRDLMVGSGNEACAEAIMAMLADRALRERIGQAGREYVISRHSWPGITGRLAEIYRQRLSTS